MSLQPRPSLLSPVIVVKSPFLRQHLKVSKVRTAARDALQAMPAFIPESRLFFFESSMNDSGTATGLKPTTLNVHIAFQSGHPSF